MSTVIQGNLRYFQQSHRRVRRKAGFYGSFYNNFIAQSKEIREFFHARDTTQLQHKLRETLQIMDNAVEGKPGVVLYMQMLGRIHQRLNVEPRHLQMWKMALLNTVKCYDAEYDSRVQAGWEEAIELAIGMMFS
jgi:hemoglobin-like flavoprotein